MPVSKSHEPLILRKMKILRHLQFIPAIMIAAACSGNADPDKPGPGGDDGGSGDGGDEGEEQPSIPPVPDEINEANVFTADFFTDLDSESPYFGNRDWNDAASHIEAFGGDAPLACLFDRCDFTVGEVNPMVRIALETGWRPFFVQTEKTSATATEGTGIVTEQIVSDFHSRIPNEGVFMSGVTVTAELESETEVCIYTTTISTADQFSTAASYWTAGSLNDGVTVGKIAAGIRDEAAATAADKYPTLRLFYAGTEGSAYDLFVLCPAGYACRGFEEGSGSSLPYYRISFEKLF